MGHRKPTALCNESRCSTAGRQTTPPLSETEQKTQEHRGWQWQIP